MITRGNFEKLIEKHVSKIIPLIKATIREAKMSVNQIDDIVLVGGSTKVPKVKELIEEVFKRPIDHKINPDEIVAAGASYLASLE